jgi:hypothetical protein
VRLPDFQHPAECNSAIRQVANLRYARTTASKLRHSRMDEDRNAGRKVGRRIRACLKSHRDRIILVVILILILKKTGKTDDEDEHEDEEEKPDSDFSDTLLAIYC